jgi:hypothetical protein
MRTIKAGKRGSRGKLGEMSSYWTKTIHWWGSKQTCGSLTYISIDLQFISVGGN